MPCTLPCQKEDKDLLDPDIIEGIRCKINLVHYLYSFVIAVMYIHTVHINYKYPCATAEEERERWGSREGIIMISAAIP